MKQKSLFILLLTTQIALGQKTAVKIFAFRNSQCEEPTELFQLRTRIVTKELLGNILTVKIAATATCCVEFVPKMTYKNGILDLGFEETGEPCECFCCYEFSYQISGLKDANTKITFRGKEIKQSDEKYETYPIRFKMLNGDTINYVDKYGLMQGVWTTPSDSLMSREYAEFDNNRIRKKVTLYPNGKIQREFIRDKITRTFDEGILTEYQNFNRLVEYYSSGQRKKECYNATIAADNSFEKGKCKEWNESGVLTYEGDYRP